MTEKDEKIKEETNDNKKDKEKKILDIHPTQHPNFVNKKDPELAKEAKKIVKEICTKHGLRIVSASFTKNVGISDCVLRYQAIGTTILRLTISYDEKILKNGIFKINLLEKLSKQIKSNVFGIKDYSLFKMLTKPMDKNSKELASLIDHRRYLDNLKDQLAFELAQDAYILMHGKVTEIPRLKVLSNEMIAEAFCNFVEKTWATNPDDIVPSPKHAVLDSAIIKWFLKYMAMKNETSHAMIKTNWLNFTTVSVQKIIANGLGVALPA